MKLWVVYEGDGENTQINSVWDDEQKALKEAERLSVEEEKSPYMNGVFYWVPPTPFYLNETKD